MQHACHTRVCPANPSLGIPLGLSHPNRGSIPTSYQVLRLGLPYAIPSDMLTMTPTVIIWADSHETLEDLAYKCDPFYRAAMQGYATAIINGERVSDSWYEWNTGIIPLVNVAQEVYQT
jgi:hypothetical protein